MSDSAVQGANYGAMYGWGRFDHEAQVSERCMKLGAVLLSPNARQQRLDELASSPRGNAPAGFNRP